MNKGPFTTFVAVVAVLATGCGNNGLTSSANIAGSAAVSTKSSSQYGAAPTSSAPVKPAKLTGIVMISHDGSTCTVQSLDPSTGQVSEFARFTVEATIQTTAKCPKRVGASTFYSPDFQRAAVLQKVSSDLHAGWLDREGTFTAVSPKIEASDFSLPAEVHVVGFDKRGNFYYTMEYGNIVNDSNWHNDLFRVPAGSTTGAQLVGSQTAENHFDVGVAPLPGGELGITKDGNVFAGCSLDVNLDGPFDPDRTTYFFSQDDRIYKSDKWCVNGQNQTPITPKVTSGIIDFVVSPDGSKVIFQTGNKAKSLYQLDTTGSGDPVKLDIDTSDIKGLFLKWIP